MASPKKEKKIDAVEMMRKIRDDLAIKYNANSESEDQDLAEIRAKYKIKGQTLPGNKNG